MHYTGQPLQRFEDPHLVTGKGAFGELPTVATPVAVAKASMDALSSLGVCHIDTPLSPEKIWRALHSAEGDRRYAATAAR